ncbi:MAG: UDP-glucose 4-epimerase GalE [Gammaproteobacteria bacterium]|nr:UDP-glucose 4-epimerase GalE [Gammaproteobacteria bacterium]
MSESPILVTGGAGYIGNHVVHALLDLGFSVVVLDNLSTGRREAIPDNCEFVLGDAGDKELLAKVFKEYGINSVLHFAGFIIVEESVEDPLKYYQNNTLVSLKLIESCVEAKIDNFIFSSTAAVYGDAREIPVLESSSLAPLNPYGFSKAMTEQMLRDAAAVSSLNYIILRYFNVAGADPQRRTGQRSKQSTHLIKLACETALGKREQITVFGNDYPTPDGTCIRDYIHVSDLAMAHVKALEYLQNNQNSLLLNCGYGEGSSVSEVLTTLQKVIGREINIVQGPRRAGDAAELVANNSRLLSELDWEPQYNDLKTIIYDALEWEKIYCEGM